MAKTEAAANVAGVITGICGLNRRQRLAISEKVFYASDNCDMIRALESRMPNETSQVALILHEVDPFLKWLFEQSNGETMHAVNAYAYCDRNPNVTPAGIERLHALLAEQRLIRYGMFHPEQRGATGDFTAVALTKKGFRKAFQLFRASHVPQNHVHNEPSDNWVTVSEAAKMIDISKSTITRRCNSQMFKCVGTGRDRRVDLNSITKYKADLDEKRLDRKLR